MNGAEGTKQEREPHLQGTTAARGPGMYRGV